MSRGTPEAATGAGDTPEADLSLADEQTRGGEYRLRIRRAAFNIRNMPNWLRGSNGSALHSLVDSVQRTYPGVMTVQVSDSGKFAAYTDVLVKGTYEQSLRFMKILKIRLDTMRYPPGQEPPPSTAPGPAAETTGAPGGSRYGGGRERESEYDMWKREHGPYLARRGSRSRSRSRDRRDRDRRRRSRSGGRDRGSRHDRDREERQSRRYDRDEREGRGGRDRERERGRDYEGGGGRYDRRGSRYEDRRY